MSWEEYLRPEGTPCADKACSALKADHCRYPGWTMCAHPVPRPADTTRSGNVSGVDPWGLAQSA